MIVLQLSLGNAKLWSSIEGLYMSHNELTEVRVICYVNVNITCKLIITQLHITLYIPKTCIHYSWYLAYLMTCVCDNQLINEYFEWISSQLPKEIGLLTSLQRLDFSYNGLTTIPDELGNLERLYEV